MTVTAATTPRYSPTTEPVESLTLLARVAQCAIPPRATPSLGFQLASATSQLGSFLHVRGDEDVEHYLAAALALATLEPASSDTRPYEGLLLTFLRYDRRKPNLPLLVEAAQFRLQEANVIHFIQELRDQRTFQSVYTAARQVDSYSGRAYSCRRAERLVLLSREIAGKCLLVPLTPPEELFVALTRRA
jgi:hypothetical protein